MFDKDYKGLLKLANTEAGKFMLGANKYEKISKLVPNGYFVYQGRIKDKDYFIARFNTFDRVKLLFLPTIDKINISNDEYKHITNRYEAFLHFSGLQPKNYKYPQIYATINTYTANGGGQGRVRANSTVYATAHNAASGTVSSNIGRPDHEFFSGDSNYYIGHGFAPFDSSSLGSTAQIVTGANTFVRAVGGGATSNADSDSVSLVASGQASNTSLTGTDYATIGSTKFATDITFASWSTGGNNDFQLNANGVANISKTSYSKFAWTTALFLTSSVPTGINTAQMVDNTNLLSVEFTLPVGNQAYSFII